MTAVQPMTWDQFVALGETRHEYIDGALIVNPSPRRSHQQVARRVADFLDWATPPGYEAVEAWSWKPSDDEFIPDVMLVHEPTEDVRFTGIPVLVVEILSSDRAADLVLKSQKYAEAGLENYWVIDIPVVTLSIFTLEDGVYRLANRLTGDETTTLYLEGSRTEVSPADLIGPSWR